MEELENLWEKTDEDLNQEITINQSLVKKITMKKIKSNLTETRWENLIELGVNIFFLDFFKNFCWNHYATPKFFLPGLFMLLLCILAIIMCSYKLFLISRINRKFPILTAQRNLALIQYFNRIELNALFMLIPIFSITFMIVAAKGNMGLDLYALGFPSIPYTIGCFLVGVIIVGLMKIFPDKKLQSAVNYLKELKEMKE